MNAEKVRELIAKWREVPSHQDTMPLSDAANSVLLQRYICANELEATIARAKASETSVDWTLQEYDSEQCEVMGEKESHIAFFPNTPQGRQHAQLLIAAGRARKERGII